MRGVRVGVGIGFHGGRSAADPASACLNLLPAVLPSSRQINLLESYLVKNKKINLL